ncbi:MAG: T9SS type A sorting domain-containing protein [Flavobacteriales bacterium]|nr:T9SS type A sorting domain-containing protein [Flavobacteriales bacterium]
MYRSSISILKVLCLIYALSTIAQTFGQDWEELAPSPFPQRHHAIGFSYGGYGYVISGSNTNDVWKYTPETDSWEQLDDYSPINRGFGIGEMNGPKGFFGFGNVSGGPTIGPARDLWRFDGETETFEQLTDCPCLARTHPALVAFGDKVYMGLGYAGGNLGDWWEYDIPTDTWTEKATFIGANRHHPYQFVIDDYVYVGSGHFSDWYRYDPSNDSWSQIADHPSYIRVAGAQFTYDGKGYTLSGVADYNGSDHEPMPTGEFWQYYPISDIWTELPPHPGTSRWAPAYFIIDGWVYMVSGETYDGENATYRYQLGEATTSLDENPEKKNIHLYPMPFENTIVLPAQTVWRDARIFDLSGSEVKAPTIDGRILEITDLSQGMYILEISDGESAYRQRILKQ